MPQSIILNSWSLNSIDSLDRAPLVKVLKVNFNDLNRYLETIIYMATLWPCSLHSFGKPPCMAFAIAYDSHRQSSFRIVFGRRTILKIKHLNCLEDMNRVLINRNTIHKCFMIYILYSLETAISFVVQQKRL